MCNTRISLVFLVLEIPGHERGSDQVLEELHHVRVSIVLVISVTWLERTSWCSAAIFNQIATRTQAIRTYLNLHFCFVAWLGGQLQVTSIVAQAP
jgi:hypothetical protein